MHLATDGDGERPRYLQVQLPMLFDSPPESAQSIEMARLLAHAAEELETLAFLPLALMHEAGVVVSFNSDDRELARHLNHEAAKAVKYGGVAPEEALKFVTLNPARQLRIDQHVGSLEVGKHADFVVWSGPPLSILARCEQTWIDWRLYFDRQRDARLRQERNERRAALIQKILLSGEAMLAPGESSTPDEELWPREDIFCHHHDHGQGHSHHDQDSQNRLKQLQMLLERQE